jgi:prolipoprotein diacylglyceryltransferase
MRAMLGHGPISQFPERWVRVGPAGRWAGFTICGVLGLAIAMVWTAALAVALGRPAGLALVLAGAMVSGLLVIAGVDALLAGRPRLVCFHGEVAALTAAAGAVALTGQPVLASLDIAVPGLATFLACGRVGCLVGACCHGRPATRGIRYGSRHIAEGLCPEYVGVPLLPVAAVEAAALVVLTGVTTGVVLSPARPGTALAGYLLAHVWVRFWLEFLRGDEGRPQLAGLSEAQWTALAVTGGLSLAVTAGWQVLPLWLPLATLSSVAAGVALVTIRADRMRLRDARHIRDLARVVRCADAARGGLVTAVTHCGVRVSASARHEGPDTVVRHYAFSRSSPALTPADAAALGRIATAVGVGGRAASSPLYRSGNAVYHLVTGDQKGLGQS